MSKLATGESHRISKQFLDIKNGKVKINEEVFSELKKHNKKVLVVSILGSCREGKSFALNRVAGVKSNEGFQVESGACESVTKGIQIMCRPHPVDQSCLVIYLDTEGLDDAFLDHSNALDNPILTIAFLNSDVFIYNNRGTVKRGTLDNLGFLAMISKQVKKEDARKHFPKFVLLLRDLDKEDLKLNGKIVQPITYLEHLLRCDCKPGSLKEYISTFFEKKTCIRLSEPADKDNCKKFGSGDESGIRKQFLEDEKILKECVLDLSNLKCFDDGKPYTTSAFCSQVREVIKIVEGGKIPQFTPLHETVAREESSRVMKDVFEDFKKGLDNEKQDGSLAERYQHWQDAGKRKLDMLGQISKDEKSKIIKEFEDEAKRIYETKVCKEVLKKLLGPILQKEYSSPGAKEAFEQDLKETTEIYRQTGNLGPMKDDVFATFKKDIEKKQELVKNQDEAYAKGRGSGLERSVTFCASGALNFLGGAMHVGGEALKVVAIAAGAVTVVAGAAVVGVGIAGAAVESNLPAGFVEGVNRRRSEVLAAQNSIRLGLPTPSARQFQENMRNSLHGPNWRNIFS